MHTCIFLDFFSFLLEIIENLIILLTYNLINFCTKFKVKQVKFLPLKSTSLLLCSKLIQTNCLNFSKFLKDSGYPKVNQTKLTSKTTFAVDVFA